MPIFTGKTDPSNAAPAGKTPGCVGCEKGWANKHIPSCPWGGKAPEKKESIAGATLKENDARYTADELNKHLEGGGVVQVTTHGKSVLYKKAHAGVFFEKDGSLYVRRGSQSDKLSMGDTMLVHIRTGRVKTAGESVGMDPQTRQIAESLREGAKGVRPKLVEMRGTRRLVVVAEDPYRGYAKVEVDHVPVTFVKHKPTMAQADIDKIGKAKSDEILSYADKWYSGKLESKITEAPVPPAKKIDTRLRTQINLELSREGLDGNKSFMKPGKGLNALTDVLDRHGIELDDTPSLFPEHEGRKLFHLAWSNKEDPFSPASIEHTLVQFSWYKRESGTYECLAYLT